MSEPDGSAAIPVVRIPVGVYQGGDPTLVKWVDGKPRCVRHSPHCLVPLRAGGVGSNDHDYVCTMCWREKRDDDEKCKELRQAGKQVKVWTAKRDDLIRAAIDAGGSLREVGEAVGLSHTAVKFIAHGRPPKGA